MIYYLILSAVLLILAFCFWSVWGVEKYYKEKLHGEFYGPWSEIDDVSKAYVVGSKEFKKWKIERLKKLFKR